MQQLFHEHLVCAKPAGTREIREATLSQIRCHHPLASGKSQQEEHLHASACPAQDKDKKPSPPFRLPSCSWLQSALPSLPGQKFLPESFLCPSCCNCGAGQESKGVARRPHHLGLGAQEEGLVGGSPQALSPKLSPGPLNAAHYSKRWWQGPGSPEWPFGWSRTASRGFAGTHGGGGDVGRVRRALAEAHLHWGALVPAGPLPSTRLRREEGLQLGIPTR